MSRTYGLPGPARGPRHAPYEVGDKGEGLGKYEFPRPSTIWTEVLIDALAEAIA
jgi:hypothetical protein